MDPTKPLAITISRQMGSGGAYIGQQLAKRLGFRYVDREIITKAAEAFHAQEDDVASRDERFQSMWNMYLSFNAYSMETYLPPLLPFPTSYDLFDVESKIIAQLAEQESSVIIGRCGFHVLKEHPNHVAIFLHANSDFRCLRIQQLYGLSEKDAREKISESDKARSSHIHAITDRKWTDARLYDLCVDTSRLGVDKTVDLVLEHLRIRSAG